MHHPKVVQSPIANDWLELKIDSHTEPQLFPKFLLQMSVRELHNTLFSTIIYGGLKEARYEDDNTIISDSTLCSLITPQFKNVIKIHGHAWFQMLHICQKYAWIITVMAWFSIIFKRDLSQNDKNWRSGGKSNRIYKTYKIKSCHMGAIFTPTHMIWQRKQCVLTHTMIMCYHTGNVCWDVVTNVLALILLTSKQTISIPNPVIKFVFIFILWLHVVKNMAGFHYPTRKVADSVNRIMLQ